jgi:hypothetical protein
MLDTTTRFIVGGILDDGTEISYPKIMNRDEAWCFVKKHYPARRIHKHIRATVDNMPEVMSLDEIPNFVNNLD